MGESLRKSRVSNDTLDDAEELRRRIADEGYLFFRDYRAPVDPEYTDVYCEVYKLSRFTARATGRKCWKDLEVVPRGIPAARLSERHICPFSVRPRSRLAGFLPMRYYVA